MDAFHVWMIWVMLVVAICVIIGYIGYFKKRNDSDPDQNDDDFDQ